MLLRTLLVAVAAVGVGVTVPNIGGRWLDGHGNAPQDNKYVPVRLGAWTGGRYAAPTYTQCAVAAAVPISQALPLGAPATGPG